MKKARLIKMGCVEPVHPGGPTVADVHEHEVEAWMREGWQVIGEIGPQTAGAETVTAEAGASVLPDIDLVSAAVHTFWVKSKLDAGIKSQISETGAELMVPYDQLPETSKGFARQTVGAVYAAIETVLSGTLPPFPSIEREAPSAGDPAIPVAPIAHDETSGQPAEPDTHPDEKASQAEGTAEADGTGADASAPQTAEPTGKKGGRK